MAATVSSPWSKPGAWALDAEEQEAELQEQHPTQNDVADFPSLSAAAKQPKKKKQTLSLSEFASYGSNSTKPSHEPGRLTHNELLSLPTGPRQRSSEELDRNRLGGAFKSYGLNARNGDDSSNSRYSRAPRESNRELPPSRADEVDDWSKAKKSTVGNGFERRERGSFFESHSKADESESWVANKPTETRRFSGGSGFERRGSFDSLSRGRDVSYNGGGADSESWGRRKEDSNVPAASGATRSKLVLQPRTLPVSNGNGNEVVVKPKGSNPFGEARPREEVLAEKGLDHKEIDEKLESMKINGSANNKEVEKGRKGADTGSRWSFGSLGGERGFESSWRKPDATDSGSRPQSAEKTENGGHAAENGVATDNGNTGEN